jgi:hypothetical protein
MKADSRSAIATGVSAFAVYLIVSLIFFGRMLPGHLADYYIGRNTDPSNYMWALAWWPYVMRHHVHPFLTQLIDAPVGMNLASAPAPMPLLGILMIPLTNAIGPIAAYNIILMLLPPIAALSGYLLCRKLTGSFVPALAGGFLFGFSPYVIGQLLSHMNLLLIFPIPLAVLLVLRRFEESISRSRFVALLTVVLSIQFLLVLEPFAMTAFVGAFALLLAWRRSSEADSARIVRLSAEIGGAYLCTALLMSPYLYFYFAYEHPTRPLWPSLMYSIDLLNFFVPTSTNALGSITILQQLSAKFPGNIFEQDGCIGIPLFVVAALWMRRHRGELMTRIVIAVVALSCILAIGPYLQIAGHLSLPMPWLLVEKFPLIRGALPVRMMLYAFLGMAMIFALWLADPLTGSFEKALGTFATVIILIPNPSASFWVSRVSLPEFFRDGNSRRLLSSNDVVLPLPFGQKGMSTLWQASSGMNFRLVSGLNGLQPIEIRRWPLANVFFGSWDLPEPELQLKAFVANLGITSIILDASDSRAEQWRQLLANLGITPDKIGGVFLYRINLDALRSYRAMNALEMERRADRARLDALLSATDRYLAKGGDPSNLTVRVLETGGLFPADWKFDPTPNSYRDIWAGGVDGKIAVGVVGSQSSLEPLMDGYGPEADQVYFPYPHRWFRNGGPDFVRDFFAPETWGSTSGESLQMMLLEFDRSKLREVAARVSSQPSLSLVDAPRATAR